MNIFVTKTCPACEGHKVQLHHSWDEYHVVRRQFTEREFFLHLGYLPDEPLPPKIVACSTCKGLGEVEAWQPLEVVLPKIWEAFRQFRKGGEHASQPSL